MDSLKDKYKTYKLDDLCNLISKEINELSQEEYKLKVAYVLMHIIEESQKALGEINTKDFVTVLKEKIENVCKESEKQKDALEKWFSVSKTDRDAIEGTNEELENLSKEIEVKLNQFKALLVPLVENRDKMNAEDVVNQKKKRNGESC